MILIVIEEFLRLTLKLLNSRLVLEVETSITTPLLLSQRLLVLAIDSNSSARRLLTVHGHHAFSSLDGIRRGFIGHLSDKLSVHLFRLSLLSVCLVLSFTILCHFSSFSCLQFIAVINLIELLVGLGV